MIQAYINIYLHKSINVHLHKSIKVTLHKNRGEAKSRDLRTATVNFIRTGICMKELIREGLINSQNLTKEVFVLP